MAKLPEKKICKGFEETQGIPPDSLYTVTFPLKAVSLCSRTAAWIESAVKESILERIGVRDC